MVFLGNPGFDPDRLKEFEALDRLLEAVKRGIKEEGEIDPAEAGESGAFA
jgi:hypothetical protein